MQLLYLSNEHITLSVAPDFGARVTQLIDRTNGRDWLVAGALEGSAGEGAIFGAREARGWDECFPTVAPCQDDTHQRSLRDHGDMWGRRWSCEVSDDLLRSSFDGPDWRFVRDIKLVGNRIETRYELTSKASEPIPYLWSQHCLLATVSGDRIELQGVGPMTVTGGLSSTGSIDQGTFEWPELTPVLGDLRIVRDVSAGFAIKAYAPVDNIVSATIGGAEGSINLSWAKTDMPYLGIWLDYGGWPEGEPVHQIAIEPTTAPADDLAGARKDEQARWLARRETHRWTVTMTVSPTAMFNGE